MSIILQENGDKMLAETGDNILLELSSEFPGVRVRDMSLTANLSPAEEYGELGFTIASESGNI